VTHKGAARCDAACSPLPWQLTRPGNIAAAWRDYPFPHFTHQQEKSVSTFRAVVSAF